MINISVINARGEAEPFSFRKVFASARRAGASNKIATEIALKIRSEIAPGTKTSDIFRMVREMLAEHDYTSAVRFNLKEAIRRFGSSGFPFEKYIAGIYARMGYRVDLNKKIKGKCVAHEIDFIAKKEKEVIIGECKYRISPGDRVDVKNCLANYARLIDLQEGNYLKNFQGMDIKSVIITNAKFTNQAIKYSKCIGMDLIGWRYPTSGGLEEMIESQKLYPITILPSFKGILTNLLSMQDKILIQDILKEDIKKLAEKSGIQESKLEPLISEAKNLIQNHG